MSIVEHYKRLAEYDAWANLESIRSLREAGSAAPKRAFALMAHIVAAERLWLERISHPQEKPPVWPEWTLTRVEQEVPLVREDWHAILGGGDAGLQLTVEYHNSKGERWVNAVGDIFHHVMMHGTYHRGQIASLMRRAGMNPAYTDYIEAVRRGWV
jgi:uncharacterized damage-inducible protein DinB